MTRSKLPRRRTGSSAPTSARRVWRAILHGVPALATVAAVACEPAAPGGSDAPWHDGWRYRDAPSETFENGVVVTTDVLASQVGADILAAGGNAVDAAVAVSFALAVVNPEAGNIGGGGFMVARMADGSVATLDYREKAPLGASRDMYLDADGNLTDGSVVGHLASGVPGSVAGMWEAHQRFGTLPWEDLVQPAVELAEGFPVRERFLNSLGEGMIQSLAAFPASATQFLPRDGQPPVVGDTLRQPDLARTMERIRDQGRDGFYLGETAALVVAEMERGGGLITAQDLAEYQPAWREPVVFDYRDHTVYSMAPSSSGGVTMAEAANILEGFDLPAMTWDGPERIHLLAEAWRRAYADRNHYLGDPDYVEMPLDALVSDDYAAFRRGTVYMDGATPSTEVGPGVEEWQGAGAVSPTGADTEGEHTTHFSIVDAQGNAVAITTTINSWYGSKVTVAGAGFVLNNEMDDFAAKPGTPNQFGLVQGENNAIAPGKRMLSAMSPAIVLDPAGDLHMVTGTPGGSTIISTVLQTILNVVDHGMTVSQAVQAPRVHHQHLPDQIWYEAGSLPETTLTALEALGHTVVERGGVSGDVQAIVIGDDGRLHAFSDPRRGGAAAGY